MGLGSIGRQPILQDIKSELDNKHPYMQTTSLGHRVAR